MSVCKLNIRGHEDIDDLGVLKDQLKIKVEEL
mgnify:CR=1 FL=1